VAWSYSNYIDALEKEDILNKTNEDTFSCLSGDSGHEKPRSAKPTVDVSDLRDLKAPQAERLPEPEPEIKPTTGKKKQNEKSKKEAPKSANKENSKANSKNGSAKSKVDKKVSVQIEMTKKQPSSAAKTKSVDKSSQLTTRDVPASIKRAA